MWMGEEFDELFLQLKPLVIPAKKTKMKNIFINKI
jgi:hypothetical protein